MTVTVMFDFKGTTFSIIPYLTVNSYHLSYPNLFHTSKSINPFHINLVMPITPYSHTNIFHLAEYQ